MRYLNNRNNNKHIIATTVTTVSVLAIAIIILASTNIVVTPVAAQQTTTAAGGNTITTTPPNGIKLSSQPVYREHVKVLGQNPINETHMSVTFSGTGTLSLPNSTQTINTTSNGSAIISFTTISLMGKETIKAANGDTATATFYEIDQEPANNSTGETRGIVIAVVNANASTTGRTLAPFNNMILAGTDVVHITTGESDITLWRWESGISSNSTGISSAATPSSSFPTTQGEPSSANNNNSNTNALTTANDGSPSSSSGAPSSSTSLTAPY